MSLGESDINKQSALSQLRFVFNESRDRGFTAVLEWLRIIRTLYWCMRCERMLTDTSGWHCVVFDVKVFSVWRQHCGQQDWTMKQHRLYWCLYTVHTNTHQVTSPTMNLPCPCSTNNNNHNCKLNSKFCDHTQMYCILIIPMTNAHNTVNKSKVNKTINQWMSIY